MMGTHYLNSPSLFCFHQGRELIVVSFLLIDDVLLIAIIQHHFFSTTDRAQSHASRKTAGIYTSDDHERIGKRSDCVRVHPN